ncbi:MAG: hypothetical protein CL840_08405 [Crocinitomicaceae bacterium]|nr:hypothetical protein [Crocinitomicaceae bacterium]
MYKAKIVIIEDEFFAADHLGDLVEDLGFQKHGIFHSGEDFLAKTDWEFDAALVDIFLAKKITGLEVAAEMTKKNKPFIFLTANKDQQTLVAAAKLNPEAYLSKPFNTNDVTASLEKIRYKLVPEIKLRGGGGLETIKPSDILFIKSDGAYVEIETPKKKIIQRLLLHEFLEELPENFKRVHRSYVVNMDFVEQFNSRYVVVGKHKIPISRSYKGVLEH